MAEPTRTLRTALNHGGSESPPRTILIASAIQGEGKSLVTKSLALGFFQGGARTLVIDGDLRKPSMHAFFGVEPEPGLSDVLRSGGPLEQCVRPILLDGGIASAREEPALAVEANPAAVERRDEAQPAWRSAEFDVLSAEDIEELARAAASPQDKTRRTRRSRRKARPGDPAPGGAKAGSRNGATHAGSSVDHLGALDLLPCGSRVRDPAALLGTPAMRRLLSEAADSYDVVLVDSSPLLAVSDAVPLARAVDGVILVTRSDYTTRDAAEGLRRTLERLPDVAVVGLVANGVRDLDHRAQHRYRYPDAA
jgi:Mrp family chromosome partitioning ATPase